MKSRLFPRKSDSKPSRDVAERLLRNGAVIKSPKRDLLSAADHLASLGLIEFELVKTVLCANAEDRDFGRGNRNCAGRIVVADGHEDSKSELCCPDCHRRIYPDYYKKLRFIELRASVSQGGVTKYCKGLLSMIDLGVKVVADGVFRLDVGGKEVFTCLIDFLTDGVYWSQSWAALNPACFLAVNPNHARFREGNWLAKVTLAELVCGNAYLPDILQSVAARGRPQDVPHASVALFGKGPARVALEPARAAQRQRRFHVEVGQNIVRVEGVQVVWQQADSRFVVFRTLWSWFLDDLRRGVSPDDFSAWTLLKITEELAVRTKRAYHDLETVRRIINRLQSDIATAVKKTLGLPIGRDDIIETCGTHGKSEQGYRINPRTVLVRPLAPNLSE